MIYMSTLQKELNMLKMLANKLCTQLSDIRKRCGQIERELHYDVKYENKSKSIVKIETRDIIK